MKRLLFGRTENLPFRSPRPAGGTNEQIWTIVIGIPRRESLKIPGYDELVLRFISVSF